MAIKSSFQIDVLPFDMFGFHLIVGQVYIILTIMWFEISYTRKNPIERSFYNHDFVEYYKDNCTLEIIYSRTGWNYGFWVSTDIISINIDIGPIGIFGWYRWAHSKE